MLDSLTTMSAPKILEEQEMFEKLLGNLLLKAALRHEELCAVPGNRWQPGDRCEDALLGGQNLDGAEMALMLILQFELELDARMDAAQRMNEQDDSAFD